MCDQNCKNPGLRLPNKHGDWWLSRIFQDPTGHESTVDVPTKTRGLLLRIIDPQMQGIVWIKSKARVMGTGGRNIYPCPSCIVYGSMCRRCLRRRTGTFRSRAWATHAWYRWGCDPVRLLPRDFVEWFQT